MVPTWVNSISDSLEFLEKNSDAYYVFVLGSMKLQFRLLRTLLLCTTRWMSNEEHSDPAKSCLG